MLAKANLLLRRVPFRRSYFGVLTLHSLKVQQHLKAVASLLSYILAQVYGGVVVAVNHKPTFGTFIRSVT